MKKAIQKTAYTLVIIAMLLSTAGFAQQLIENSVKITLSGTSTIHEWDMMSTEGSFSGKLAKNAITNVSFVVPVKSLVSGKSAMDRNTYNAMNADKYENIVFAADMIETLNGNAEVKGKMIINNVAKEMIVPMTVTRDADDYILQGFTQIRMTDFNVEPPKFMMGSVKTGEVVSVKFIVSIKAK